MAQGRSHKRFVLHAREAVPFLKWAGGKRRLIPKMSRYFPPRFNAYVEPFLGGGAVFFHLNPSSAILADDNKELITTYRVVRDNPNELINALKKHIYKKDYYYFIREQDPSALPDVEVAARMIYLNRTGYNGLYRVNSKGKFNVPFGRYENPTIVDEERILGCSEVLQGTLIEKCCFKEFPWDIVRKGDFVYFDPPYIPLSKTSNFTQYQEHGFSMKDQEELAELYRQLDAKGVLLMLSNAGNGKVRELYEGFRIIEISAPRMINSKAERRGEVIEHLVINY